MITDQLRDAVILQLGYSEDDLDQTSVCYEDLIHTLSDIVRHGIDGGFTGFIYYTDTTKFATDNREDIMSHARDMASDLGMDGAYSLIASFNCFNDNMTVDNVVDAIHDENHEDHVVVLNALAWFAAEEVATHITDM